jgi:hypothetical protein
MPYQYRTAEQVKIRATNLKTKNVWHGYVDDFCHEFGFTREQQENLLEELLNKYEYIGQTWIIQTIG